MSKQMVTLYKYISVKYAKDIIANGRLKMSNGESFNDPFELLVCRKGNVSEKRIEGLQILCLTNSREMKLMWSHYADSHKGLCLAVKVPKECVYPVVYSGKRPFVGCDIDAMMKRTQRSVKKNLAKSYEGLPSSYKIALIKDRKWSYEKEYRIVLTEKDIRDLADGNNYFYPVKIERVYLGCRFEKNDAEVAQSIVDICQDQKIPIKKMVLSESDYSVKIADWPYGGTAKMAAEEEFAIP